MMEASIDLATEILDLIENNLNEGLFDNIDTLISRARRVTPDMSFILVRRRLQLQSRFYEERALRRQGGGGSAVHHSYSG